MLLSINNVSKQFEDDENQVLNNVDLQIEEGEFVCVVGKSGCGKSTLLNLIAGLAKPTDGEILLNGEKIVGPGADRTVMFQEHALFPWLNVYDNVCFGMKMAGTPKQEMNEKAMRYLKMVGLDEYKDYRIHKLSGGMRQRVALARALTLESKILLMDEPFSALDKQTSNYLREELQSIWMETGKTIFFITHSAEEAVYLGTRVIVMSPKTKGIKEIIQVDLERPRHVYDDKFIEYRHHVLDAVKGE